MSTRRALLLLSLLTAACGGSGPGASVPDASLADRDAGQGRPGAEVLVVVNTAPRLTALGGEQAFVAGAGEVGPARVALRAAAEDDDGDDVAFTWSSPGCPEALAGAEIAQGRDGASGGWSSAAFEAPADRACLVEVEVRDLRPSSESREPGARPEEKGGVAIGLIQLSRAPAVAVVGAN